MADRLTLNLVTPTRRVLSTEADEVVAPGATGAFGVRPGHTAFITTLGAGPLVYYRDGVAQASYAVIDGFVEVAGDTINVLAEEAVHADEIEPEAEERAMAEARTRMGGHPPESETYRREAAIIRRSAARIFTARRR